MQTVQPNVPKSVVIGGKRVRIRIIADLDSWGEYHHDKCEIHLAARALLKRQTLRETLRHEVMHAALSISGVSYCTGFQEEAVIRCMETVFFPSWDALHAKLNRPPTPVTPLRKKGSSTNQRVNTQDAVD